MIQTIKQNKKAVLAFLLALVMVIGLIPFTATEVQAVTIPVGDITTNDSFGNGDTWETGDSFTLFLASKDDPTKTETHKVTYDGANWSEIKSSILPAHAFAYTGVVNGIKYIDEQWNYDPVTWLDQSTAENLAAADVMIATGEATKEYSLALKFEHLYTKVTFNIEYASEFADTDKVTALTVSGGYIDVKAFVGETTAEVIIPPRTYTAGELFATVTVNGDTTLKVKAPEGFTFEAGTNYTFDLKVGKDKVEIETVTVNGEFPGGWENEVNLDDTSDIIGTPDEGKTKWEDGDFIVVDFTSDKYGNNKRGVKYSNNVWTGTLFPTSYALSYLENETPTVNAIYSPYYTIGELGDVVAGSLDNSDSVKKGECEFIKIGCTLSGNTITADFSNVTRNYSRLRIVGLPNQTLTVNTTDFTPAGATSAVIEPYTLTTDENGNAFLYGTFAEGATISVKQGEVTLKDYTFTESSADGISYALGAVSVIDGTLGGKTEATEEEVNALVEQLKAYVDNGITTIVIPGTEHAMYDSALGMIPAYAEALYLLTDLDRDGPYCGTIDLILPDATEIIDFSFYNVVALKSITLPKVTTVGDGAFYGCQYLEKITFGSVITEVVEIKSGVFASLGTKSDNEACDLVLNCGQLNAEDKYKPNLESNVWYIGEWSGETEWKSITLIHTGECDECKAQ